MKELQPEVDSSITDVDSSSSSVVSSNSEQQEPHELYGTEYHAAGDHSQQQSEIEDSTVSRKDSSSTEETLPSPLSISPRATEQEADSSTLIDTISSDQGEYSAVQSTYSSTPTHSEQTESSEAQHHSTHSDLNHTEQTLVEHPSPRSLHTASLQRVEENERVDSSATHNHSADTHSENTTSSSIPTSTTLEPADAQQSTSTDSMDALR